MSAPDPSAFAPAAALLGRLLVRELDAETLADLRAPEVASALRDLGIEPPAQADLGALAADYFACFLHPAGTLPPVQSLWQGGQYDGDAAVAVRAIAAASGRELAAGARAAAPDHLGCILSLWADLSEERPQLAARLQRDHLAWGIAALAPVSQTAGFYAAVARSASALLRELTTPG